MPKEQTIDEWHAEIVARVRARGRPAETLKEMLDDELAQLEPEEAHSRSVCLAIAALLGLIGLMGRRGDE